jgi:hypothetical protein
MSVGNSEPTFGHGLDFEEASIEYDHLSPPNEFMVRSCLLLFKYALDG